ncbi:MAG: tetratricopeptide repeat protein [Rhodospirillaceae bacterium]|nr:tetratricopeptide repeat protein [Rhodospirillaceae bacterium]MBT5297480.1 tetratricopeptide repeat protein [Rhodospirillaceae bacterium]MBT6607108.1 tetratricopeptide repeat protein [Rhodospirillaceae bacterium]
MARRLRQFLTIGLAVISLGGCGLMQGDLFSDSFWAGAPFRQNNEAELGIAELAKGNYITAEAHFKKALRGNPRDIDALIGAGILYQNTGQLTKSRQMYESVLALRPDESKQFVVWSDISTRPASQIASVNLALLDSGGVTPTVQSPAARAAAPAPTRVMGAPAGSAMLGRTAQPTAPSSPAMETMAKGRSVGAYSGKDSNVMSRFSTIKALRDQGLITPDEFNHRRQTNVGALLPLTSPPPAAGLDRSVPTTEQIAGRLRAIGRALEMRAISVAQHSAERSMILDAMMPSAPVVVANPALRPKGLMEAADSVRRLEKLRNEGFISSDEYARERQAIELAMRPASQPKAMAAKPVSKPAMLKKEMAKSSGPQPAVHLASYKSMKQAQRGWAQIKRAHKSVLGSLKHEVSKVRLGKKGTYYRLKAGPFKNAGAAKGACRSLKRRRQFCEPSMMGAG